MADYGLLSGLAEGLKQGYTSYKDAKKEAFDRAIKEKTMKMEELKTGADLAEKLGGLPPGYFSKDTLGALGASQPDTASPAAPALTGPEQTGLRLGAPDEPSPPAEPQGLVGAPPDASATKKDGLIKIPGLLSKPEKEMQDKVNAANVQLFDKGYEAKIDPKTRQMTIVPKAKTPDQLLREEKSKTDLENSQLEAQKKKKDLSKPEEFKDNQYKAALYANKAESAEQLLKQLSDKGFDPTTTGARFQSSLPGFAEGLKSGNVKTQELAEREFIAGVLRRESGAAISADEYKQYGAQYFPRTNDPQNVVEAKAALRQDAIRNLKQEAAGAYRPPTKLSGNDGKKTGPPPPKEGDTKDYNGIKYKVIKGHWEPQNGG